MNEWMMMIVLQMSDDDAGECLVEIARRRDKREIRVSTMVNITHMHAAIEHNSLPIDFHHYTALPNFLTSTYTFIPTN